MNRSRKEPSRNVSHVQQSAERETRGRLTGLATALLKEWKSLALPLKDESIVVAVSGGADSVALLLALDELLKSKRLALQLTVAHLDHGLRGTESTEDAHWVRALSEGLGYKFELGHARVKEHATVARDNLEQAARRARYEFLEEVAKKYGAQLIVTAHTMDDQAETVLMRLLRGSGAEGLGGMDPVRPLMENSDLLLSRPLVSWARRAATEGYCRERNIEFRVDAMNEDEKFTRVRVRRKLLPLLETFNPKIIETLSRAAGLLREDAVVLNAEAEKLLKAASIDEESAPVKSRPDAPVLDVNILASAPRALRLRALRLWLARGRGDLRRLELVHLSGVEKLLEGERGGRRAELPGNHFVERRQGRLTLK